MSVKVSAEVEVLKAVGGNCVLTVETVEVIRAEYIFAAKGESRRPEA